MSDTPRTDAAEFPAEDARNIMCVRADFSRQLERELQAALMVQGSAIMEGRGELIRYGIRWAGPREPIADYTLPGGYWTPWHIAQQRIEQLERELSTRPATPQSTDEREWVRVKRTLIDELAAEIRSQSGLQDHYQDWDLTNELLAMLSAATEKGE